MEVGAREGHEFDISAMFDRVRHPARGRRGGEPGAPTTIGLDDSTAMRGKGRQHVPHGRKVMMAFPGGAGYGDPKERDPSEVRRDLALGYITPDYAKKHYGIGQDEIEDIQSRARAGEVF
jgi:N-methylhydantoinase B